MTGLWEKNMKNKDKYNLKQLRVYFVDNEMCFESYHLTIYDRFSNLLYEKENATLSDYHEWLESESKE